jgi:hypothetical protein
MFLALPQGVRDISNPPISHLLSTSSTVLSDEDLFKLCHWPLGLTAENASSPVSIFGRSCIHLHGKVRKVKVQRTTELEPTEPTERMVGSYVRHEQCSSRLSL